MRMFHILDVQRRYGVEPRAITLPECETFVNKKPKFQEAPRHMAVSIDSLHMFVACVYCDLQNKKNFEKRQKMRNTIEAPHTGWQNGDLKK